MINESIEYKELADKSLIFYNIPDGDSLVTVKMRPLSRRDRLNIKTVNQNDPDAVEKVLSLLIVQWGDREGITSIELMDEIRDDAVLILTQAFQEFFQKQYKFTRRP